MSMKPRRTKSLLSLQHSSNKKTPWDDEEKNKKDTSSQGDGANNAPNYEILFRLSSGISVRRFRRTDAKALQELLDSEGMNMFFPDTVYTQPFTIWRAHKLIDKCLDKDEDWRLLLQVQPDHERSPVDVIYDEAVKVFAQRDVDKRLSKLSQPPATPSPEHKDVPDQSLKRSKDEEEEKPKVPLCYAIANEDDKVIGLIEHGFEDVPTSDYDFKEGDSDPAFFHDSEILYLLSPDYRRRGIMTEVVSRFCAWSWPVFPQLERITAAVYSSWNPASSKVLQKTGFVFEGRLKGAVRKRGKWGDLDFYTLFRPGGALEDLDSGLLISKKPK